MPSTDRNNAYKRDIISHILNIERDTDKLANTVSSGRIKVTSQGEGGGGDASAANQTTQIGLSSAANGLLTTIETNTDSLVVTGNGTHVGALRVTFASDSSGQVRVAGGNVQISGPLTAFGELLVGELSPQVHITFPICNNTDIIKKSLSGGTAAITTEFSMIKLSTGTGASQTANFNSRRVVKYRTGLGVLVRFTGMFTIGVSGTYQWIGMGDGVGAVGSDGLFFGYNGTAFGVVRVQNGTQYHYPQTSWSVDQMDGSGPSGMTLDKTKLNLFQITSQWLGAGNIRFYVEDPNTGLFQLVHVISYPNQNIMPNLYNPILPLSAWVSNGTTGNDIVLKSASMMGSVEGKNEITGPSNSYTADVTTVVTTETGFVALQNREYFPELTVPPLNRVRVYISAFSGTNDTNKAITFSVYQGRADTGTQPGGTWSPVSASTSVMEYINTPTGPPPNTVKKLSIVIPKDNGANQDLAAFDVFLGPLEWIWVTVRTPAAGDVSGTFVWKEDF
jgi:hypothetical protein